MLEENWKRKGRGHRRNQMGRNSGEGCIGMSGPQSSRGLFEEKLKTAKSTQPSSIDYHVLAEAKVTRFPEGGG